MYLSNIYKCVQVLDLGKDVTKIDKENKIIL